MPKLPRVTVVQFGNGGPSTDFGQFSSKTVGAPQTSKSPSVIMQLAGWLTGWTAAAVGAAFNPYLEDMNGCFFVIFYFIANLFERGIPDWDAGTTYYLGATVQDPAGSGAVFSSLVDNNLNNALPLGASNANWLWTNPPEAVLPAAVTANVIPKVGGVSGNGPVGSQTLVPSAISDDGVDVVLSEPLKFPDGSVQSVAAQPVSAQNVVTGARALDTVFHNGTSRPLFVAVSLGEFTGAGTVSVLTDANAAPATEVLENFMDVGGFGPVLFFIVLPGNYYKVKTALISGGPFTLAKWTEWS